MRFRHVGGAGSQSGNFAPVQPIVRPNQPRMINFTGAPEGMEGNPYYGSGLEGIDAQRQALAEVAGFGLENVREPFGGAAYMIDRLGSNIREAQISSAEQATRERLGEIMSGVDLDTGPTQEQIQAAAQVDLGYAQKLYEQAVAMRNQEQWTVLTPDEVAKLGLDPARDYKRDRSGNVEQIGGTGQTVQVGSGEKKWEETKATSTNDMLSGIYKSGVESRGKLAQLGYLNQLISQMPQTGLEARGVKFIQDTFGISLGEGANAVQVFDAIVSSMVPLQRPEGSGTMSDRDVALFRASLPDLMKTPEGNRKVVAYLTAMAQYNASLGEIANKALALGDPNAARQFFQDESLKIANPLADFSKPQEEEQPAPDTAGGTEPESEFPEGTKVEVQPDGSRIITFPDGLSITEAAPPKAATK